MGTDFSLDESRTGRQAPRLQIDTQRNRSGAIGAGRFSAAAATYAEAAVLAREVGTRMDARLDVVRISPARVADIGCATGEGIRTLQRRYPQALPLALDWSAAMLGQVRRQAGWMARLRGRTPYCVAGDARALPLKSNTFGLVWSNLMLHWLDDPLPAFRELLRTMEVGGLLMFSLFGPDTLKELRAAGATQLRPFHDMHNIGDMLLEAGFADPVMDIEYIELTYARPRQFLRDQRHLGVRNGLLGPMGYRQARGVFGNWQRRDGRLPATFEIAYGHAWKPQPLKTAAGHDIIRFQK